MGLSVYLEALRPDVVHENSIRMENMPLAENVSLPDGRTLYHLLCLPHEMGITHAWQLVEPLNDCLSILDSRWMALESFDVDCSIGRARLRRFVLSYLEACAVNPDARVISEYA